ncbi:MFS transporter [Ancylobacter sp. TS-1]|uniref:MFS transporter n=1 Tax=Ancylobacter sp. TS-1 TaxID=1850374 RepID=UPI001390BEA1|nr:MFS transporter [Ancylobacter sp. TS-1]
MTTVLSRLLVEPAPLAWFERQSWHPWLVVGLVCVGAFVGQLDATIVQLALPTLGRAFDAPLQEVSWVALSYLLAFAAFLPIFGRLCEMFGRKTLYIAGYAIFIAASALCALATGFEQLLAFRFLQGMGGALLGANSISLLVATISAGQRGRALGFFAAAQAVGMSAGPALGGLIVEGLGWRWIFGVTVPFGALAMVLGWVALPRTAAGGAGKRFDWGGALLIGPAIILVVATLNHLSGRGAGSPLIWGAVVAAAVLLWALVRRERSTPSPLIAPRLFANPAFAFGALAVMLAYALLYGIFFLLSFAQDHGYGESPAQAGLRLAIIPVAIGLSAPFSHDVKLWLGARRIGPAGMLLCLLGLAAFALAASWPADHRFLDMPAFILAGVGIGLFIAPNNHAAIAAAPADLAGAAGSLLNLMRVLGTSLGVAAGATTLAWRLEVETGTSGGWMAANAEALLAAFRSSLPVLGVLALGAALAAWAAAGGAFGKAPPRREG